MTLDALTARLARLETAIDDHDAAFSDLTSTPTAPAGSADSRGQEQQEQADPLYPDVVAFVEQFFAPAFARPLGGEFRWCPHWWDHTEAGLILEACWRTFEHFRLNPQTGISDWLTHHLYPHLHRLMSPTGPFARCNPDRATHPHEPDQSLRTVPPSAGWPAGAPEVNDPYGHDGDAGAYLK
ncbi:hypothetical protein CcI156_09290 [Frankia sp. CcI156]|uniref:DUF4913 domain-containing protein n=1 Tax=Frankia casuarinae (strain DSM 45818 / CECT 9043 / HFP020203 / CcI3) TaxID=106370 RepID=UPI000674F33F|nr:hypothetical protein CcI156_09290 [Frankia sp. CcI156]ORT47088.1 hypothetical protein KBI5_21635 [Frankia sp. KB5]